MRNASRNLGLLSLMPTLFDDFFNGGMLPGTSATTSSTNTSVPAVNIKESGDKYEVEVAAPGMAKEDFKVELDGNELRISSERNDHDESTEGNYTRREFSYQSFSRVFTLQKDVMDVENIEARYDNGLLRLSIPKREEARLKGRRLIQIA